VRVCVDAFIVMGNRVVVLNCHTVTKDSRTNTDTRSELATKC